MQALNAKSTKFSAKLKAFNQATVFAASLRLLPRLWQQPLALLSTAKTLLTAQANRTVNIGKHLKLFDKITTMIYFIGDHLAGIGIDFIKHRSIFIMKLLSVLALTIFVSAPVFAQEYEEHTNLMSHGDGHLMDMAGGMVMGQNTDKLPGGCDKISETKEITVHAGHKYAEKFPGRMFAFDTQEYNFKPCTKLTVHFVNDDNIRHQWMMHGLPKYLYNKGMFHLEVTGPAKISGTLILPPGDKTYLVHCDIAQHMEKGMKGQLKVGKGDGDLPSIPGVSDYVIPDDYSDIKPVAMTTDTAVSAPAGGTTAPDARIQTEEPKEDSVISGVTVIGLAIGLLLAPFLARKFKGMSAAEIVAYVFDLLRSVIDLLVKLIGRLINMVSSKNNKVLPEK